MPHEDLENFGFNEPRLITTDSLSTVWRASRTFPQRLTNIYRLSITPSAIDAV